MHCGVELSKANDFSAHSTGGDFTQAPKPSPTSSLEEIRARQCKCIEATVSSWSATASRPDICLRLAQLAARVKSLNGGGIQRTNDLVETEKER